MTTGCDDVEMTVEWIGVPFDGFGRSGHQDEAAAVLRDVGFPGDLARHGLVDRGELDLPAGRLDRGAETSLLNEDTMPLDVSEDGEAANTEIGLLLGLTGRLLRGPLAAGLPALGADELAILGPRDEAWRRQFNVGSLRHHGVWLWDWREVAGEPERLARAAVGHLQRRSAPWWLHVDLDVLDPVVFPAQGLPAVTDDPDGLTWPQLTSALVAAVAGGGCLGWSVAIYDPAQDPRRAAAAQIVALLSAVLDALPRSADAPSR